MKKISIYLTLQIFSLVLYGQSYKLQSPNGKIYANIEVNDGLSFAVFNDGNPIVEPSSIVVKTNLFDIKSFGGKHKAVYDSSNVVIYPIWGTFEKLQNLYNQLNLDYGNGLSVQFRCYNTGFAWRLVTNFDNEIVVFDEPNQLNLPINSTVYFPEVSGFLTPFEVNYLPKSANDIEKGKLALTLFMYKTSNGELVVISESNLFEYPGMFIQKEEGCVFRTVFPKYPKKEKQQLPGRLHLVKWPQISRLVVKTTEDFIARSEGTRTFPWRVIMIANSDAAILNNNLVSLLADEPKMDFTWVKPGKVVWDWYHNWNLQDVDFEPGINTQTYKYMVDFAAKNGIEYINIDDGWCKLWNFKRVNPNLNLDEVIAYAKSKGVKVFIWAMWNTLDNDLVANLDMFQRMGVAGLKVDFFDRTDQRIVDFVNRLASECAKRKLLLNLHGMYKPTGLTLTYPNVVNIEGVLGLEYNKFSDRCTPTHNLTIPFVRNVVGPMDYTPGSMRHAAPENFKKSWNNPHSMTTRAQQMAMYVVYHGGVQMLADSPTLYEKDSIALDFLSRVPVTWNETRALSGEIGKNISVARRSGKKWYIGCMTATAEHEFNIDFNFLDDREYNMTVISSGSSDEELVLKRSKISSSDKLNFMVKPRSGLVIILE